MGTLIIRSQTPILLQIVPPPPQSKRNEGTNLELKRENVSFVLHFVGDLHLAVHYPDTPVTAVRCGQTW